MYKRAYFLKASPTYVGNCWRDIFQSERCFVSSGKELKTILLCGNIDSSLMNAYIDVCPMLHGEAYRELLFPFATGRFGFGVVVRKQDGIDV